MPWFHPADIPDRDGGVLVLSGLFGMYPLLLKPFVDGGYQGPQFYSAAAAILPQLSVEVVKTVGSSGRLRGVAETLDRRAHIRLVGPMPQAGKGLREPDPKCSRPHAPCFDPPHAAKAMQSL